MSQELVYTSVPRGLAPGSHGFSTVACTRGMAANLQQQLESLSGYRQLYPPQDPRASLNPVVFSHLLLSVAGRRVHVLSRICDAGLDYTQRTNKFAHHVVLDAAEAPAAGPAWLLERPGFMRSRWEGEPCMLPAGPAIPTGDAPPHVCRAWQQVTGDAGFGGALAETAAANRQAMVVFPPGTNVLALLAESLALVPAELRWRVTFSTYFNRLPAGVACQWRCVADGTPEAAAARHAGATHLVLDLCRPGPCPSQGPYIEMARTGRLSPPRCPAGRDRSRHEADESTAGESTAGGARAVAGPPPPPMTAARPPSYEPGRFLAKPRRRWPWVVGTAASMIIVAAGALAAKAIADKRVADERARVFAEAKADAESATRKAVKTAANVVQIIDDARQVADEARKAAEEAERAAKDAEDAAAAAQKAAGDAGRAADAADKAAQGAEAAGADRAAAARSTANDAREAARTAKLRGGTKTARDAIAKAAADADKARDEVAAAVAVLQQIGGDFSKAIAETEARKNVTDTRVESAAADLKKAVANLEQASSALSKAVAVVEKAGQRAKELAASLRKMASSAKTLAGEADAAAAAARDAAKAADGAASLANKAVAEQLAAEAPVDLPPCVYDTSKGLEQAPEPLVISQIHGAVAGGMEIIGLSDALPEKSVACEQRLDGSLGCVLNIGVARQLIASFTVGEGGTPQFQWYPPPHGEQRELADLLRNCLLSVRLPHYNKPAVVRLRRAKSIDPLTFSSLAGLQPFDKEGVLVARTSVELTSMPPGKEVSLELLRPSKGWRVAAVGARPGQPAMEQTIEVGRRSPLRFALKIREVRAAPAKTAIQASPYNKNWEITLRYLGAGDKGTVLYPGNLAGKCREKNRELDRLCEQIDKLREKSGEPEKQADAGDDLNSLEDRLRRIGADLDQLKKGNAKALRERAGGIGKELEEWREILDEFERLDLGAARVRFRLYLAIDAYQVDLVTTKELKDHPFE